MKTNLVRTSKFLSLVLRHKPEHIGLTLDEHGWADVEELIVKCHQHRVHLSVALMDKLIASDNKGRFSFNEDRTKFRANQGHSIKVDLQLAEVEPVKALYHGTARRNHKAIREEGLKKMKRHHVHLSADYETALIVGKRYDKKTPMVYRVDAPRMALRGHRFYLSENGVWLTDHVPPRYLQVCSEHEVVLDGPLS
jgi:putative RNA 2'-phosphotransferase